MMERIFKALVLTSLSLYLIWYASFLFSIQIFGIEVAQVLMHGGREAWLTMPVYFEFVLPLIWTAVAVGLVCYKRWARPLFVLLLSFSFFHAFTGGLAIMVGPQYAISLLTNVIDGAVCFMLFFSSVASKFEKKSCDADLH